MDVAVFAGGACEAMRGTWIWGTGRTPDPGIKCIPAVAEDNG